jgi:hypothetical protein
MSSQNLSLGTDAALLLGGMSVGGDDATPSARPPAFVI